jgi:putative AlgH/UPF0301 family transcriptional regulator
MPLGLLIASPQMRDPNFAGTVVLMCHHDDEGALGVVINRITSIPVVDVLNDLGLPHDARPPASACSGAGPSSSPRGFWSPGRCPSLKTRAGPSPAASW